MVLISLLHTYSARVYTVYTYKTKVASQSIRFFCHVAPSAFIYGFFSGRLYCAVCSTIVSHDTAYTWGVCKRAGRLLSFRWPSSIFLMYVLYPFSPSMSTGMASMTKRPVLSGIYLPLKKESGNFP